MHTSQQPPKQPSHNRMGKRLLQRDNPTHYINARCHFQMTLLLESGCDVNSRNGNSDTPLMVALYQLRNKEQRERAIKQLLEAGADVNARNGQGRTPLMFACALDQADSIRLLLQKVV